jgi:hypothetical protein
MCVDCVLTSLRIAQVDPSDEPLSEVILSQGERTGMRCSPREREEAGRAEPFSSTNSEVWSHSKSEQNIHSWELLFLHIHRQTSFEEGWNDSVLARIGTKHYLNFNPG